MLYFQGRLLNCKASEKTTALAVDVFCRCFPLRPRSPLIQAMSKELRSLEHHQRSEIFSRQENYTTAQSRRYQPNQSLSQSLEPAAGFASSAEDTELARAYRGGTIFSGAARINVAGGHFVAADVVNQYIISSPPILNTMPTAYTNPQSSQQTYYLSPKLWAH
ncbi:hypothetical protein CPB84DRAFT_1217497 [Gymnopilus junonius]|uniref:Uncharacterized protein n=1 Tax=Gymnopilus junonius TaxID=109634 RepID=A0A9P5P044_GYMJU|nr:hypothetical protein CPB84DRAFT_1217497 [Gymnopilus junonius]